MPQFRTLGIVLRRTDFGEADRILTVLTPDHGLISVLAKGLKKIKSHRAGALELFRLASIDLHRRSGELFLATDTAARSDIHLPTDDGDIFDAAFSIAAWVVALVPPEKPLPEVFALVRDALILIAAGHKLALIRIAFEARLLALLGFLPELTVDTPVHRLIKFCASAAWRATLTIADEPAIFAAADAHLRAMVTAIADRPIRTPPLSPPLA